MTVAGNILEARGLSVSFDGFRAIDGLDFTLAYGELRFVIGPNGAGKTTLLDIITGKTKPDRGTLLFDGHRDLQRVPEHRRVSYGIGRKFQTPAVFSSLTVAENLEAAYSFREPLLAQTRPAPSGHRIAVADTLAKIGLEPRAHTRAGVLSHGEKQWLEIGMLLIQQPRLLLLDEPVAGMTRRERDRTGELLLAIARERAVLVVEHDMDFVRRFAHTVTVLHTGRLLCEGPVDAVQRDPRVIEVYLGRSHAETKGGG